MADEFCRLCGRGMREEPNAVCKSVPHWQAWHEVDRRAAYERGVRTERAAVIAWLRDPSRCSEKYDDDEERADAIERGEHLDKEGGGDETRK